MLHLTPTILLELFAAEYLPETNTSTFISHSLMVTCSLDAWKKFSQRKEMRIKKEKVEVLTQNINSRKIQESKRLG